MLSFTDEEVRLIRAAAEAMPARGERDVGKAQLSSLVDLAQVCPLEHVLMDLDSRIQNERIRPAEAGDALKTLLRAITVEGKPGDSAEHRRKRANALRYVNKLRRSRDETSSRRPNRQRRR